VDVDVGIGVGVGRTEGKVTWREDGVTGSVVRSPFKPMTTDPVTHHSFLSPPVTFPCVPPRLCADINTDTDTNAYVPLAHNPCEQPLY
jgi:hypothetical protein